MLTMYLDFINIMGIELHAREMLSSEVSRDRRELAKVRSIQVSLLPHFSDVDKFDIASTFIPMPWKTRRLL